MRANHARGPAPPALKVTRFVWASAVASVAAGCRGEYRFARRLIADRSYRRSGVGRRRRCSVRRRARAVEDRAAVLAIRLPRRSGRYAAAYDPPGPGRASVCGPPRSLLPRRSPPITGAAKGPLPRTRHVYEVSTFHRVSPGSCGRKVAPLLPSSHPSTHWAPIQTPRSGRRGRPHRAQRRRDSPRHTTQRTTSQAGRSHLSPPRASGPGGCECFQTESMPPPAAGRSSRSAWSSSSTQPSKAEPTAAPVAPAYLIREARTHHLERRRGHPGCFGTNLNQHTKAAQGRRPRAD